MAIIDKITAIADAIREKTNTTEKMTLAQMPEMISGIKGGDDIEEFVNFYDYDGTLLHQYPLSIFENMAALPQLPNSREDCECVGWNYDIDTIKAMKSHVNVAAIYNQKDEDVEVHVPGEPVYVDGTKLYMHFDYKMPITIYFRQNVANGVTVNWGDGESSISNATANNNNISLTHTFQAGDYTISFEMVEKCILSLGWNSTSYCTIAYHNGQYNATTVPILSTLQKAEIDLRNTSLTTAAFRNCISLKEIIFGNGRTTTIPSFAFQGCWALEHVNLCDNIIIIYEQAFQHCYRLRNITIPTSVTAISNNAFSYCYSLHDIYIPGTVKTINNSVFSYCYALKKVRIGSGVQTLGSEVFKDCRNLKNIYLSNTIKTIGTRAFDGCCALTEVVLPNRLTSIPQYTYQNCYALKNIIIPNSITSIASYAFSNCYSLRFIGLPIKTELLYTRSFTNCYALKNVSFSCNTKNIQDFAFENIYGLEYIIIPPSVTTLGSKIFSGSNSLKNVVLPPSFTNINGIIIDCCIPSGKLKEYYQNLLDNAIEIKNYAFQYNKLFENISVNEGISTIGSNAFSYCYNLQNVSLPLELTEIKSNAFENDYALKELQLPDNVTSIRSSAFNRCNSLQKVTIPKKVLTIESGVFVNCYSLQSVEIQSNSISINNAFSNCFSLDTLKFTENVLLLKLSSNTFSNTGLEKVINLPKEVQLLGHNIFNSCYALEEVDLTNFINNTNNDYENSMFYNCYALSRVKFSDRLTTVGGYMFYQCFALEEIILGSGITIMLSYAFNNCYNLKKVTFTGIKLKTIQSRVFINCYKLKEIRIPYSVTSISSMFSNCYLLRDVYMYPLDAPTGTTSLGNLTGNYTIHVPKGYLDTYQERFTGHAGHFKEFEYVQSLHNNHTEIVLLSAQSIQLSKYFISSRFTQDDIEDITIEYDGTNVVFNNPTIDFEKFLITIPFVRNENFDYTVIESLRIMATIHGNILDIKSYIKYLDTNDLLLVYKNSIEDMSIINYSADGGWQSITIDRALCTWSYNGKYLTKLCIESNGCFGINNSAVNIQVNNRDNYSRCYYYRYLPFGLMVRWCGWDPYTPRDDDSKFEFEIYFINNGDLVIRLVEIGTRCYLTGTYKAFNTSFSLNREQRYVALHRLNEAGTNYEVEYTDLYIPRTPIG